MSDMELIASTEISESDNSWGLGHRFVEKYNLPESLMKAIADPFDYAIGLRGGMVIRFNRAEFDAKNPNWIHLKCEEIVCSADNLFEWPRGIDVRISDILWCCDAPEGS